MGPLVSCLLSVVFCPFCFCCFLQLLIRGLSPHKTSHTYVHDLTQKISICMYICRYMYVLRHLRTCVHRYIGIYVATCIQLCVYVYIHIYVYIKMYVYYVYVYVYIYVCICIYAYMYACIYARKSIYIYIYIYILLLLIYNASMYFIMPFISVYTCTYVHRRI